MPAQRLRRTIVLVSVCILVGAIPHMAAAPPVPAHGLDTLFSSELRTARPVDGVAVARPPQMAIVQIDEAPSSADEAPGGTGPASSSENKTFSDADQDEWEVYVPISAREWIPPTPVPPPDCASLIPQDNIPCLLVVGQILAEPRSFTIHAGCARSGTGRITYHYDGYGRVDGFDLAIEDGQGTVFYQASIEIEYDGYGRKVRYGGTVSGDDFPAYRETIENHYDSYGKIDRANVAKVYVDSGCEYTMSLTPCWLGDRWSGYKVKVYGNGYSGQEFVVGHCSS